MPQRRDETQAEPVLTPRLAAGGCRATPPTNPGSLLFAGSSRKEDVSAVFGAGGNRVVAPNEKEFLAPLRCGNNVVFGESVCTQKNTTALEIFVQVASIRSERQLHGAHASGVNRDDGSNRDFTDLGAKIVE